MRRLPGEMARVFLLRAVKRLAGSRRRWTKGDTTPRQLTCRVGLYLWLDENPGAGQLARGLLVGPVSHRSCLPFAPHRGTMPSQLGRARSKWP